MASIRRFGYKPTSIFSCAMFTKLQFPDALRILKPLIALALSYALIVHGFALQQHSSPTDGLVQHEICITTLKPISWNHDKSDPEQRNSDHQPRQHSLCCLNFGSSDLPQIGSLFSIVSFGYLNADYPPVDFNHLIIKRYPFGTSLPRAPPQTI